VVRLLIISLFISAYSSLIWAASARIDRSTVQQDETINLVLRIETNNPSEKPELSLLEKNFYLLGNRQTSRHMITNGQTQSYTEWHITLMPKKTGSLTIPSIKIGKEATRAIALTVTKPSDKNKKNQAVFIETDISHQQAYVQEQLLFTVRIFTAVQLDNMSMTPPELDSASIQQIAQNNFYRNVSDKRYHVTELRYAIFPEKTGELIIPELIFSAEQRTRRNSIYGFSGGSPVRKLTKQFSIDIKAPPLDKTGAPWLPAQGVALIEDWSGQAGAFQVGQSVTRTIELTVVGALPQYLAPIVFDEVEGAKLYPDHGVAESSEREEGILAVRSDSVAIIPTRPGTLTLPAIKVRWWDTETKTFQEEVLPERTLKVLPAPVEASTGTPIPVTPAIPSPVPSQNQQASPLWQFISILLAIGWLSTLWRWHRFKKQVISSEKPVKPSDENINEKNAYKAFEIACKSAPPQQVRIALINWATSYWNKPKPVSLDDLTKLANNQQLTEEISLLSQCLYGEDKYPQWRADTLLSLICVLRKKGRNKKSGRSTGDLPPLYQN